MTKTKPVHPKLKAKPKKDGSPRYKPGTHPVYTEEYENRVRNSWILNDQARSRDLKNSGRMHGAEACKATLRELTGKSKDNPGYYKEMGTWFKARIPNAEEQLKQVHAEHNRWAKEQVRKARYLELPKHWPDDLLEKRLKGEACLDIYLAEKNKLENLIEELESRGKKEEKETWLPHGPITTHFNEKAADIDGQEWDVLSGELPVPYIADERSPYFKMTVVDYIEMAKEWKAHVQKLGEQEAEKIIKRMEQEVEQGKRKVPPTRMQKRNLRKKTWKTLKFTEKDFPKWPKGVKPVDELEKAETG